jgi:large subunit ribosomal protein L17
MQRNLAQSLFEHGQIRTTLQKAKDLRPFVEKLITLAKRANQGSITARRGIDKLMTDRSMVPAEHIEAYTDMSDAHRLQTMRARSGRRYRTGEGRGSLEFTGASVTHRLINKIAPKYMDREGGYTRIIRLAKPRLGDAGQQAVVQMVGDEVGPGQVTKPDKTSRKRKADARYAFAIKLSKKSGGAQSKKQEEAQPEPVADAPEPTADTAEQENS